jgi:hypothetical protein
MIRPGKEGPEQPVVLEARPLAPDPDGKSSHFMARAPQFKDVETFGADISIGSGLDLKRLIFEISAVVVKPAATAANDQQRRFACSRLCLGVELTASSQRCPRCGSAAIELRGAPMPGLGTLGRHGGQLALIEPGRGLEAVLASPTEFRIHRTNERLDVVPLGELTGTVHFSTDERFAETVVEIALRKSADGGHLVATIPDTVKLPVRARYVHDFKDGTAPGQVDFFFQEITPPQK